MIDPKLLTTAVHAGTQPDETTGAVMTPIYQTSTFAQTAPGEHKGWDYSRGTNPSRDALEKALSALEGAEHGVAFASGLAAEHAIVQNLQPKDHVLVCHDVYGGSGRLFRSLVAKYDITFDFIDMRDVNEVAKKIQNNTVMIWMETPTNPTLQIFDISQISALAKKHGITTVVDNTFASPIFQRPLALGADIVVHSTTKYIGGHSDLIGGAVMLNNAQWAEKIRYVQFAAGAVSGPLECFLMHRSIKTLVVRMMQHAKNAQKLAEYLEQHKKVRQVYYPGLPSHPQHELAKKQMQGFSGIISFDLDGDLATATRFVQSLRVFTLAESLGGVESLVNHPEKMTHASVPEALRRELGINESLLRLSVGIEYADDLIEDVSQALARC